MTSLEKAVACAEAMGLKHVVIKCVSGTQEVWVRDPAVHVVVTRPETLPYHYDPERNKAQAFELIERFKPDVTWDEDKKVFHVWKRDKTPQFVGSNVDLRLAAVDCVAKMQSEKATP
jgi:hypothetical protein